MTATVRLEIETTTTLRDGLAAKLVRHAVARGRTPVELMADIVSYGLAELGAQKPKIVRRGWRDHMAGAEIQALRNELATLRRGGFFLVEQETGRRLAVEADKRGMDVDELVKKIVEAVANDGLFAAVLDA